MVNNGKAISVLSKYLSAGYITEKMRDIKDLIMGTEIVRVKTIGDLLNIDHKEVSVALVTDKVRGGLFFYDENFSDVDNGGTVILGWKRQYDNEVYIEWFKRNNSEWGSLISIVMRDMRRDLNRKNKQYKSFILRLPSGVIKIRKPIILSQTVSLLGNGRRTVIECDFDQQLIDNPPVDRMFRAKNAPAAHYDVAIKKTPMIFNWWLINYQQLSDITLDGCGKDVYGIYLNEIYYGEFNNLNIRNTGDSGLTFVRGQFNKMKAISIIRCGGPTRFIGCATLDIDGLDIEGSTSPTSQLDIVHSTKWKKTINISRFHLEEDNKGVYNPGDLINIQQAGVVINGMFAIFNQNTTENRYIHLHNKSTYEFDGVVVDTPAANFSSMNLFNSGRNVFIKVDDDVEGFNLVGADEGRVVFNKSSKGNWRLGASTFLRGLKIVSNVSSKLKVLWFSSDTRINFGDNSNRYVETGVGADLHMVNTYGRVVIKSGDVLPYIETVADKFYMGDKNGNNYAVFAKDRITMPGLKKEPTIDNALWNDNGFLRIGKGESSTSTGGNTVINSIHELMVNVKVNMVTVTGFHYDEPYTEPVQYFYISNMERSSHNGGTILDPTKTPPDDFNDVDKVKGWLVSDNDDLGCWVVGNTRVLRSEWFGCSENLNDNGLLLEAMANIVLDGNVIELTHIYNSSGTLHIRNKNKLTLKGGGIVSSYKWSAIRFTECDDIEIDNIDLSTVYKEVWSDYYDDEGETREFFTVSGIFLNKCVGVRIRGSKFKNIPGVGIVACESHTVTVNDNNRFTDMGGNCFNAYDKGETCLTFANNEVFGCYDSFVGMHNASDVSITDNILYKEGSTSNKMNTTGYGIDMPGVSKGLVSGNMIFGKNLGDSKSGYGINIHGYGRACTDVTVADNIVNGTINGLFVGENCKRINIIHNTISNITKCGMKVGDVDNVRILGNTITKVDLGIDAWSNTKLCDMVIKDNIISDCRLNLSVGPNCKKVLITDNIFDYRDVNKSVVMNDEITFLENTINGVVRHGDNKLSKRSNIIKDIGSYSGLLRANVENEYRIAGFHLGIPFAKHVNFIYDEQMDRSKHNGGTILDPTRPFPYKWSDDDKRNEWFNTKVSDNVGCWVMASLKDDVDIMWFGAIGDKTTDDTLSIQQALDYCYINRLANVIAPNGIFRVTKTLMIGWGDRYQNIKFIGKGAARQGWSYPFKGTIIYSEVYNAPTIAINGSRGSKVIQMTIACEKYARFISDNNLAGTNDEYNGDDSLEESWNDPTMPISAYGRYSSQVGIAVDPYNSWSTDFGDDEDGVTYTRYPTPSFPSWAKQETKDTDEHMSKSSSVKLEDVFISGFTIAVGLNPGGGDGNDDFFTMEDVTANYCKYGVSIGHTQARNFNHYGSSEFYRVFCGYTNITHGNRHGNISGKITNVAYGNTINMALLSTSHGECLEFDSCYCESTYRFGSLSGYSGMKSSVLFNNCKFHFMQDFKNKPVPKYTFEGSACSIIMNNGSIGNGDLFMISCDPQLGFIMDGTQCGTKPPVLKSKADVLCYNQIQAGIDSTGFDKRMYKKGFLYSTEQDSNGKYIRTNSWQSTSDLGVTGRKTTVPRSFRSTEFNGITIHENVKYIGTNKFDFKSLDGRDLTLTINTSSAVYNTEYGLGIGDLMHHVSTGITFYIIDINEDDITMRALNNYFTSTEELAIPFEDDTLHACNYFYYLNSRTYLIDKTTKGVSMKFTKGSKIVEYNILDRSRGNLTDFISVGDRVMKQDNINSMLGTNTLLYPKIVSIDEDNKELELDATALADGIGTVVLFNRSF